MRRTNLYLSDAEQRALDAVAAAEGRTRSDVLRALVDRDLNLVGDDEADAVLAELAAELADAARTASAGDPNLHSA